MAEHPENQVEDEEMHRLAAAAEEVRAAEEAARLCGISRASWFKLRASDRVPRPIRLGGCVRWTLDGPNGLRAWLAAGAPSRDRWEAMQKGGRQ